MLRKFKIKLNGKEYEVEMEEIGAPQQQIISSPVAPSQAEPVSSNVEAQTSAPQSNEPVEGQEVCAPMPGNILDVMVKVGDSVGENQNLLILEAMKMENNIVSPRSGIVAAVNVQKGENVDVGTVMIVIK